MNYWKLLTIVAVSIWLGAMGFFSAVVAPQAFSVLDRQSAGLLVGTVFPRYYLFGIALGSLALVGVVGRLLQGREIAWAPLVLLLLMLGMSIFTLFVLLPQLEALKQPGPPPAFAWLHRLSVALNLATMLAGLILVLVDGLRARP